VTSISIFMEDYKHDHGVYPAKLSELASSEVDLEIKTRINRVLSNNFSDDYIYSSFSNGFEITKKGYNYRYMPTANGFMIIGKFTTNMVSFKSGL
jgi:hypothetical protein